MNKDDNDRLRRLIHSEEETRKDMEPVSPSDGTTASRKPTGNTTPLLNLPDLDENNMPLPNRVEETDLDGTRVTNAAYRPAQETKPPRPSQGQTHQRPTYRLPQNQNQQPPQYQQPQQYSQYQYQQPVPTGPSFMDRLGAFFGGIGSALRGNKGCLTRGLIIAAFAFVIIGLCSSSILVYQYYSIASTLPDVADLKNRSSQFQTTRILDRNGQTLYELNDPNAGRRNYIPLSEISPNLVAATIATEDKDFYDNPGFDPVAIIRALWRNYVTQGEGGGASTITQQLARALLLSPEERTQRTVSRKSREIILAAEITRRYSKDEILELYLNEIYYGNLAYGIEAAANTYFNKSARDLTLGEAAFLAGLPQSPAVYDIYTNPESTLVRQQQVLV